MGRIANAVNALRGQVRRSAKRMPSLNGSRTSSGVYVTPEASLQVTAVYSSVRLVAESISTLPVSLHIREKDRRVTPGSQHDNLTRILTVRPNPTIDAAEFWRTVVAWMLIRGNAYVFVQRNGSGEVIGLWPVPSTMVKVMRTPLGMFAYRLSHDQKLAWLPVEPGYIATHLEILHYRWFGTGPEGLSPIGVARQQVGISVAATGYIGGFFERDATPGAIVTTDKTLTDKQWARLVEQMEDRHEGFENAHRLAVFEGGAKLERTTLSPADAQFLAIYKMTRTEIASLYGIPPHKIGHLEDATFSNIEHMGIEFVQDALIPPISRLEWVTRQLFTDDKLRIKFDPRGLMRGDIAAQTASFIAGRQWGYYSQNDIRKFLDEEPIDGGDEYLTPLNMVPTAATPIERSGMPPVHVPGFTPIAFRAHPVGKSNKPLNESDPKAVRSQPAAEESPGWVSRIETLLADYFHELREYVDDPTVLEKVSRSERALGKGERAVWDDMLAELLVPAYTDIVAEFASRQAQQLGGSFAPSKVVNWVAAAARRQAVNLNDTTFDQLADALEDLDEDQTPRDAVSAVFDEASGTRSSLVALSIVNAIGAFGRNEGAAQAGGKTKTWNTNSSNPRPSHAAMDGETVPIDEPFSNGCMWPGDPAGGVDEVAGCSCGVTFDV